MEFLFKVTNLTTVVASSLRKNANTKWYQHNYSSVLSYNAHIIVSVLKYWHHHQSMIMENNIKIFAACFVIRIYSYRDIETCTVTV